MHVLVFFFASESLSPEMFLPSGKDGGPFLGLEKDWDLSQVTEPRVFFLKKLRLCFQDGCWGSGERCLEMAVVEVKVSVEIP